MTDNHLLIAAAVLFAAVVEILTPVTTLAFFPRKKPCGPFTQVFISWPLTTLILYVVFYIVYVLFFHFSP